MFSKRNKIILQTIVEQYTATAEPVGSKKIAKMHNLNLSPATIRSVMADLEDMGYLTQPHTSAGRIPTDKGFRFYVDSLLEVRGLSYAEKEKIKNQYQQEQMDINEVIKNTSCILSLLSQYAGLIMVPKLTNTVFKHIHFIKLKEHLILAIFVSKSGIVQNKIVGFQERITQEELDKITKYINELLTDLTLRELKKKIVQEMKKEKVLYDQLLSKALRLSKQVLDSEKESEIYIEGKTNILEQPEFADLEKMKAISKAFEEKNLLIKLLDKTMDREGIQVFIGFESECEEIQDCSLVASSYGSERYGLGTLGVLGPTRMDYSRVIPLVGYTAKSISRVL
ncbi:heat-inducible transcription repressor HrcA [Candidatus Aerophobetes bacterium]|uniref:Heat-inducible transcription repressor HrcA n=1 Tax=Aerophobetes bacterium TaxID=2030807 RepID=A0A523QJ75_UNCAE|nr:MAG: heat-inducible transcription repressor HrcA [Candidatus Aerophobetes bacterium]